MKEIVRRDWLKVSRLKKFDVIETWFCENNDMLYVVKEGKKFFLVKRVGECNPKKCGSLCCKRIHCYYSNEFGKNFSKKGANGIRFFDIVCDKFDVKKNRCKIWKKKGFPGPCKQFPHLHDETYWLVAGRCSFGFVILSELKGFDFGKLYGKKEKVK